MRLYEFANAQDQLVLLRTIIDNTWTAIAQQAAQQQRAEAERKAQAKLKPRGKKRGKGGKVHIPSPAPPPPKKPDANAKPQVTSTPNQPNPTAKATTPNAIAQHPTAYPKPNPKLNPTALKHPNSAQVQPTNAPTAPKDGYFGKNISAVEKDDYGDDRHSKNGITTQKKPLRNF